MNNSIKIPKEVTVGGQIIKINNVDKIHNDNLLGESSAIAGFINIANTYNYNSLKQSDSAKYNTFLHELTHCILNTMGELDLCDNEKFVCSFAGFLTEALTSAKY